MPESHSIVNTWLKIQKNKKENMACVIRDSNNANMYESQKNRINGIIYVVLYMKNLENRLQSRNTVTGTVRSHSVVLKQLIITIFVVPLQVSA